MNLLGVLALKVNIYGHAECNDSEIRLVDGYSPQNGRVEVCKFGVWSTVCDNLWNRDDAMVVCRQLGIPFTGKV